MSADVIEVIVRGPIGPPGIQGPSAPLSFSYIAGIDLSGHRAVVLDANKRAIYANKSIINHSTKVIGITTQSALQNEYINVQSSGDLVESGWSWVPGGNVFLGENGVLTQTMPSSGFVLVVGYAVKSDTIFINIGSPIVLS